MACHLSSAKPFHNPTLTLCQYPKPCIWCCHYLQPGSLHMLGASESLLCSQVSLYKMVCMGDILYRLIQMRFIKLFSVHMQSGTYRHFDWLIIVVLHTEPYCSDVCGYQRCPQTLVEICRNMGICCGFRAMAARDNIWVSSYWTLKMSCSDLTKIVIPALATRWHDLWLKQPWK